MESCETCKKFWVDQSEVELQLGVDNKPIPRGAGHVPAWSPDLCAVCTKAEKGLEDWTPVSEATWSHYCGMKEMGATETERRDPRVRQNATALGQALRAIEKVETRRNINDALNALMGS